jgi:drug/metabolite transporter (DMT)-like permease
MADGILDALSGEDILHSNSLGTVTDHCVVLRAANGMTQTVVALSRISKVKKVTVTYPILLVVASGSLLVAAAAMRSRDGDGAGIPIAIFGLLLIVGYVLSRRASVMLVLGSERVETVLGSPGEASELVTAVEVARRKRQRDIEDE